jgi:hypothetical protein
MATTSRTRKAVRAAARVISDAYCHCFTARGYICSGCEDAAEAVLTAADNTEKSPR